MGSACRLGCKPTLLIGRVGEPVGIEAGEPVVD